MFKNSRGACPERQRGDTEVFVIIIVILAAFLLAGGQLLFQDNANTPSTSDSPGSSSSSDAWSISYDPKGCATKGEQIAITAKGPGTGYMAIEVKNGSDYQVVGSDAFTSSPPPNIWATVTLLKSAGFNTSPWRLKLFEGGSSNGGQWSGGTEKASIPDVTSHPCS